jgi:hypothetical protein
MSRPDDEDPTRDEATVPKRPPSFGSVNDPDQPTEEGLPPVDATGTLELEPVAPGPHDGDLSPAAGSTVRSGAAVRSRRRTWVALLVAAALLVIAGFVGWFVIPRSGPDPIAATEPGGSTASSPGQAPVGPSPSLAVPTTPTRPADALGPWAGRISDATGIPVIAVQAYAYAQLLVDGTYPQCHLGWTTLAGIGEASSRHGQAGGAVLNPSGRSTPLIQGPSLDGRDGRPSVPDTDAGAYDGDADHDRGMGPMLVIPAQWRAHISDADSDQIQDPYDIDDASLAVARLLCSGGENMATLQGWTAAIARLQADETFAQDVFRAADSYGQQTRNVE